MTIDYSKTLEESLKIENLVTEGDHKMAQVRAILLIAELLSHIRDEAQEHNDHMQGLRNEVEELRKGVEDLVEHFR